MTNYDIDNPNRMKLDWTNNLEEWLSLASCGPATDWVKNKVPEFHRIKNEVEKTRHYNMDSEIYDLEQLIADGKYQWADWFIITILEESEYKDYAKFIMDQIPTNTKLLATSGINKSMEEIESINKLICQTISDAENCYKYAIENNKPSAVKKTIEYVIRVNALCNNVYNTDSILIKILNYGINLIKQRK